MLLLSDLNVFNCLTLMSSRPVELFLASCVACFVSCSELVTCVFCSFFIFFSRTLLLCVVEYFVVLVNCF